MSKNDDTRTCPECGRAIFGRIDKKFCSDACRNSHNNRMYAESSGLVRDVNNILKKNRKILESLNPSGKTTLHKDKLLKNGFDFDYHTNSLTTKAGQCYHFCYDQGYLMLGDDKVLLVERLNH